MVVRVLVCDRPRMCFSEAAFRTTLVQQDTHKADVDPIEDRQQACW